MVYLFSLHVIPCHACGTDIFLHVTISIFNDYFSLHNNILKRVFIKILYFVNIIFYNTHYLYTCKSGVSNGILL